MFPAVLILLFLSVFPLIVSFYLALSRVKFVKGGFEVIFVGWANFEKFLFGSERTHFLGVFREPTWTGWIFFLLFVVFCIWIWVRYIGARRISMGGIFWRLMATVVMISLSWLIANTVFSQGRPGTVGITLVYVFLGVSAQYLLGLALALLCVQQLPGKRFFRTVFLLPMMITPVGVAYLFRMITDTSKGPFQPLWKALGLVNFSWVTDPWGARMAIIIGDLWQWTPFIFIVLLAALESRSQDQLEAARVDGANPWKVFLHITVPQILPASATLILIRVIEAFKIVDLPNVMTSGGPGTATESMTLQAFFSWRALDLGGASAIAYILLFIVTLVCLSYFNLIHQQASGRV